MLAAVSPVPSATNMHDSDLFVCARVQLKAEDEHNVAMDTVSSQYCQEFSEQMMKTNHLPQDFRNSLTSHSIYVLFTTVSAKI